jgi:hypothetical protein
MMMQLGIRKLRPGPSGSDNAPNPANYDESLANPFPNLPEVLTLKNGKKVTTAEMWWELRRPEIVEDFEREVLGRIPANVPKVTWKVTQTREAKVGDYPVIGKQLVGHVDNSSFPALNVDIQMILVIPAKAKKPVPVMMMFGFGILPGTPPPSGSKKRFFGPPPTGSDPPATEQLLAAGWGMPISILTMSRLITEQASQRVSSVSSIRDTHENQMTGEPYALGLGVLPVVWII